MQTSADPAELQEATSPAMPSWLAFFRQFVALTGGYWWEKTRWKAWTLTILVVALTFAQVAVPVAFNLWNENLFNALEARELGRFVTLLGALAAIIAANAVISTAHLAVKRRLQISWREWLTGRLLDEWMLDARHYQLPYIAGEHDNPDGRIAEDARITTETAIELGHSLLFCGLLLISFTKILWGLSDHPEFHLGSWQFMVPGYLVWVALAYSSIGIFVALALGRPMVRSTDRRQSVEADFRFGLVHARENSAAIALVHGEADERRRFHGLFAQAARGWNRQTVAFLNIMAYSSGWSILSQAFPVLIASPRYIAGTITLGTLMQTAQGFQQMLSALSWPVDNLSTLAQWRASVVRVLALRSGIETLEAKLSSSGEATIQTGESDAAAVSLHDVVVTDPAGRVEIESFSATIPKGEHILITGEPGAAEKLFKVISGLWPWGSGRVMLPKGGRIIFVPRLPYLPIGTLRAAISYPAAPDRYDDAAYAEALTRAGLEELAPRLDETASWDQQLEPRLISRLGFAKLLLRKPDWIFIEEVTDTMDPATETEMLHLLDENLPDATIVIIGQHGILKKNFRHRFVLERKNGAVVFREVG